MGQRVVGAEDRTQRLGHEPVRIRGGQEDRERGDKEQGEAAAQGGQSASADKSRVGHHLHSQEGCAQSRLSATRMGREGLAQEGEGATSPDQPVPGLAEARKPPPSFPTERWDPPARIWDRLLNVATGRPVGENCGPGRHLLLSADALPACSLFLPVHAYVLPILLRGHTRPRHDKGKLARPQAPGSVPSIGGKRLRPCTLAP